MVILSPEVPNEDSFKIVVHFNDLFINSFDHYLTL